MDFMKYRCPINTGLRFLESLKSFTTLSKQTELVEKKEAYYKAQQGVMENLKSAWGEIANYNKTNIAKDADYMTKIKNSIETYDNGATDTGSTAFGYRRLARYALEDFYHTDETAGVITFPYDASRVDNIVYWSPLIDTRSYNDYYSDDDNAAAHYRIMVTAGASPGGQKTYGDITKEYHDSKVSNSDWTAPGISEIRTTMQNYYTALESVKSAEEKITIPLFCAGTYYKMQYVVQKYRQDYKTYCANMYNLIEYYHILRAQIMWTGLYDVEGYNDQVDEDGTTINSAYILNSRYNPTSTTDTSTIQSNWTSIQDDYDTRICVFYKSLSEYKGIAQDLASKVREADAYPAVLNKSYDVLLGEANSELLDIMSEATGYVDSLKKSSEYLNNAISYLNAASSQLQIEVATAQAYITGITDVCRCS